MPRKGEYSDKYGFHVSNLSFNCGGETASAPHGALTTDGIEGAQPKRFTAERARIPPNCEDEDTGGRSKYHPPSASQARNPLNPDYHLPPVPQPPVVMNKFIRDTLNVSDIEGSQSHVAKQPTRQPKNSLSTADIEGSSPGRSKRAQQQQIGSRPDARLDVSDIAAVKTKPVARKMQESIVTPVNDRVGKSNDAVGQKERFDMLRKHGSDVVRVRHETDAFLAAVLKNPETASKTAAALEKEFKSLDVQECGLLGAREFEGAMQRSGLGVSSEKVKEMAKLLSAADSSGSGMVPYHDVLAKFYDKSAHHGADAAVPPQWYTSRQRRVKTDVAMSMGQQPAATAAAAAHVTTPQERTEQLRSGGGKRIEGLSNRTKNDEDRGESYWFAEFHGNENEGSAAGQQGGGGDGKTDSFWFSKAGADAESSKEMGEWRPTKDVGIAIDLKRKNKRASETTPHQNHPEGEAAAVLRPSVHNKAPQTTMVPSRKAQQLTQKDLELVRQLN